MVNNKLVPVIRADINGKLVTRHVIADRSDDSRLRIPPPIAPPQLLGAKEYARRIAENMVTEQEDPNGSHRAMIAEIYEHALGLYSLRELHDRQENLSAIEREALRTMSHSLFNDLIQEGADEEQTEKVFHGVLESLDIIGTFNPSDDGSVTVFDASRRAVEQAESMGIDPRIKSDIHRERYRFMMFRQMIGDRFPMDVIEINEKSLWFAEAQDRLFPHASRIMAHDGNADWELMKELANQDTAAILSEGTL